MALKAQQVEFLLSENAAIAGGTATFYTAGSSHADADKKTIWQDRNKTTTAANPVTLDAVKGTATVFADGVYDVVLKNAAGTTTSTLTNIEIASKTSSLSYSVASEFAGSLSDAVASSLTAGKTIVLDCVVDIGTLTIPIDRSIEPAMGGKIRYSGVLTFLGKYSAGNSHWLEKIGSGSIVGMGVTYPEWWGAKLDGTTDDTLPIQAALDTAGNTESIYGGVRNTVATLSGSSAVVIQGAAVASQLIIPTRVILSGIDWRSSILIQKAGSNKHFIIVKSAADTERVAVKNLYVNGNKANQTGTWDGIRLDSTGSAWDKNYLVENCYVTNCSGNGIAMVGTFGESRVINNIAAYNDGYGILGQVYDSMYTGNVVWFNGLDGIRITGSNSYLSSSKAWWNGSINNGVGFYFLADYMSYNTLDAQDNYGGGFILKGIGHNGSANAGRNGKTYKTDTAHRGYGFSLGGLTKSQLRLTAFDYADSGTVPPMPVTQAYGLQFLGSDNSWNDISLVAKDNWVSEFQGFVGADRFMVNGQQWATVTNHIRNSMMASVVAGSPGTMPTNWGSNIPSGITRTISTGIDAGRTYINIRFNGTVSATSALIFDADTASAIAAVLGEKWTFSAYVALVAGAWPASRPVYIGIIERSSGGTNLNSSTLDIRALTAGPTLYSVSHTRTITESGTAFAHPVIRCDTEAGDVIDFTIRIASPQMEKGDRVGIFVPTTSAAVTSTFKYPSR